MPAPRPRPATDLAGPLFHRNGIAAAAAAYTTTGKERASRKFDFLECVEMAGRAHVVLREVRVGIEVMRAGAGKRFRSRRRANVDASVAEVLGSRRVNLSRDESIDRRIEWFAESLFEQDFDTLATVVTGRCTLVVALKKALKLP